MKQIKHVNPYSAGTDFSRQNLTSTDVMTSKVYPRFRALMSPVVVLLYFNP